MVIKLLVLYALGIASQIVYHEWRLSQERER